MPHVQRRNADQHTIPTDSGGQNDPWDPGVSVTRRQITHSPATPAPPLPSLPADGRHRTLTRHKDRGDLMYHVSNGKRSDAAGHGIVSSDHTRSMVEEGESDLPFIPHHASLDPPVHLPSTTQHGHPSGGHATPRAVHIAPHLSHRVTSDRDRGMGMSSTTQRDRRRERLPEEDEETDGVEDRKRYRSRPRRRSTETDSQPNLATLPKLDARRRSPTSAPSSISETDSSQHPTLAELASNSSPRRNAGCDLDRDGQGQHPQGCEETRQQLSPTHGEYSAGVQLPRPQVPGFSRARSSSIESFEEWDEGPSPPPPQPQPPLQKTVSVPTVPPVPPASSSASQPAPNAGSFGMLSDSELADETVHLRALLGCPPGAPVGLDALADPPPGEKPNYPLPTLIKLAIYGSPRRRLTLQEIYQALEDRFEWFRQRTDELSWKNSIRHNLSLRKCFLKVQRPITEPGKGSYWMIDLTQGEGNKRVRKRHKKPTKGQLAAQAAAEAYLASARLPGQGGGAPRPAPYPAPPHARSQPQIAQETRGDDDEYQAPPMQTNFTTDHPPTPEEQPRRHHSLPHSPTTSTSTQQQQQQQQQHSQPSGMPVSSRQLHGHQNAAQPLPSSHDILGLDLNIDPTLHSILFKDGLSHHAVGGPNVAASHYDTLFPRGQSVSGAPQFQQQTLANRQQTQVTVPPPPPSALASSHPTYQHNQRLTHQGMGPHKSTSQPVSTSSHILQRSPSFLQHQLQPDVPRQVQMTAAPQQPAGPTQTQLQPHRLPPMRTLSESPATSLALRQQPAPSTSGTTQHQQQQEATTATATTSEFARFARAHAPTGFGNPTFGKSALGGDPPNLIPILRPLVLSEDKGKRRVAEGERRRGDHARDDKREEREIGGRGGGSNRRHFVPPSPRPGIEYVRKGEGGLIAARRTSERYDECTVGWIDRLDRDEKNRGDGSGASPPHENGT